MRETDTAFAAALASGVTTTCLCWRLTRRDGAVLAMTEHDRPLTIDGETYAAGGSLEGLVFGSSVSLAPDPASARGALSHDAITEADLEAGVWDEARVDVLRVDWQAPEHRVHLWSGFLTRVRRQDTSFEAELVSLKSELERPVGRVYARRCDAVLGDARCGADLAAFAGRSCDQRFETCRDVFNNAPNFRGFPHLPGTESLVMGPAASGNSGGRR